MSRFFWKCYSEQIGFNEDGSMRQLILAGSMAGYLRQGDILDDTL
jgi:hypothetical protein